MVIVCQTCGDEGFTNALVLCDKCQEYAVHQYCLPKLPPRFDEYVEWLCVDCESYTVKSPPNKKVGSLEIGENETQNFKFVQVSKSDHVKKSKKISKIRKVDTCPLPGPIVLCLKKSSSVPLHDLGHSKTIIKEQEFEREDRLNKNGSDKAVESLKSKSCEVDLGEFQLCNINCKNDGDGDERNGIQLVLEEGSINGVAEVLNKENSPMVVSTATNLHEHGEIVQELDERLHDKDENGCHEDQDIGRQTYFDETRSHEEAEPCTNNYQLVIAYEPNVVEQNYVHAQPLQESIWRGLFTILGENISTTLGLVAHISNLACPKVGIEAKSMPTSLSSELLPRATVWPKSFAELGPRDDSIALYFFPDSQRNEKVFDGIVNDMIHRDTAIKTVLQNAELLIFTSTILPIEFWRFQAKFFLWGVFKGKRPPPIAIKPIPNEEIRPKTASTSSRKSPQHIREMSNMITELRANERNVINEQQVQAVIPSLPKDWVDMKVSITHNDNIMTFSDIARHLELENECLEVAGSNPLAYVVGSSKKLSGHKRKRIRLQRKRKREMKEIELGLKQENDRNKRKRGMCGGKNGETKLGSEDRNKNRRTCFNCHNTGHLARECTEPRRKGVTQLGGNKVEAKLGCKDKNKNARTCFICGTTGHIARECLGRQREGVMKLCGNNDKTKLGGEQGGDQTGR